ncbi:aminotransferase class V-fold PLP-dependent enzyme [Microbacterium caowuchunii]|uniref:Aminotransferase class V-fold PLP-dependent enzyme n=1 Tax=Microbacterium caowuchunii TaxID=2614638 RepID=A0A5N0TLC9_9MICO|nr:aminotransferase class V-fold PLP-dependent enzyme [Microbacterium caowuchunii]KAA9135963.1 aminotransferase class V-fold PLP-dependent enzyme [Microbacterium caowuchunii]
MNDLLADIEGDFRVREGWVYLQSAGAGLAFPGAADAAGQYFRDVALLGCDAQPQWRVEADGAKQRSAALLNVPADEVGFFRNTSEVLNLAANSMTWHAGDEIVVFADDYPCSLLAWTHATELGASLTMVHPTGPDTREQELLDSITPRTRVVCVSHVHPWTGVTLDLTRIGAACRDVDALFMVDGIQALGAIPVDLTMVDVYAAGVFKWLMSGFGTALGVFRERTRDVLTPIFRSYGNPPPSTSLSYAAPNFPGLYVLKATLRYLEEIGWARIHERVRELTGDLLVGLEGIGVPALTPAALRAGIIAIETADSAYVAAELQKRRVSVSDRAGRTLVSPHFYNSREDIDRFLEEFRDVVGNR